MYRVYYMNQFWAEFDTRDEAVEWMMRDANNRSLSLDDYEILDRSDA